MELTSLETPQRNGKIKTVLILLCLSVTLVAATETVQNMVLTKNSLAFSIWKRSENTLVKVHIFNYTNWQRVRDGLDDRLHVEDVGPYVYKFESEKCHVRFDGDKLSFRERTSYKDVPEKTTEHDEVIVPNLPLIVLVSKTIQGNKMPIAKKSEEEMNEALSRTNHPNAFLKISAERFLWGYPNDIQHLVNPGTTTSALLERDSYSTETTINTGENYKKRLNMIEKIDGRDHLSYWGSSECNSIEGTDGSIFPPSMLDRVTPIHVFYPNLNRRIAFEYERDVEMSGIKLMRYRMQRNAYDDPSTNPANQCYCYKDTGTCPPKGIIDLFAWTKFKGLGLISLPHFSLGDPKLSEDVSGMKPNPALYENYIDLHPTLGIALRGKTSWQFNIQVRKGGGNIWRVSFLRDGLILPVAWFSLVWTIEENTRRVTDEFKREDILPLIIGSSFTHLAPPTKKILEVITLLSTPKESISLTKRRLFRPWTPISTESDESPEELTKFYTVLMVLLSVTFVLSLIIIGTMYFCSNSTTTPTEDAKLLSNMVLSNKSLAYSIWKQNNVQPLMKVRLFNYTNLQQVEKRQANLHVEEVGPYVYRQQVERVNVKVDGDRLHFQERTTFKYVPELTTGKLDDQLNVPNLPLIGIVSKTIGMDINSQVAMYELFTRYDQLKAFVNTSVERFLWGYKNGVKYNAIPFMTLTGFLDADPFGLLVTRNGTISETLTINTGENDENRTNIIEKVNGREHLKYWNSPECNSIEGSDGSIFPSTMLDRVTPIHVFYPFLCRRIAYEYERDVEMSDGIKLLRYRLQRNVFDVPSTNPANPCHCEIDTETCLKGIMNIKSCVNGLPALISLPHFSLGDPMLTKYVSGMKPNPDLYENYVDLHPTLGIALRGKSSFQLNIQVRDSVASSRTFDFMPIENILPVAWIEIGFEREDLLPIISSSSCFTSAMKLILLVISIIALFIGIMQNCAL